MEPDSVPQGSIRTSRLLLGGFVAALFCLLSGFAIGELVLSEAVQPPFDEPQELTPEELIFVFGVGLRAGFGFLVAWLYAAIRPRFGPGVRSALIAGSFVWLGTRLYAGILVYSLGVYAGSTTLLALGWALAEMWIAGLIAGWLYREPGPAAT